MQKVEGSSPFIRFKETPLGRGDAPGMTIAARSGVIPEHGPGERYALRTGDWRYWIC